MDILVIFLMGTGHRGDESDSTIPSLFRNTNAKNLGTHRADSGEILLKREQKTGQKQAKIIFDGIGSHGTGIAQATSKGFGNISKRATEVVVKLEPRNIILIGHSRGAALTTVIANELAETGFIGNVNIFAIDPVARSRGKGEHEKTHLPPNVARYLAVLMEDETARIFTPMVVKTERLSRNNFIRMPGRHGTATQLVGDWPIGRVVYQICLRFLKDCGAEFTDAELNDIALVDLYFQIHLRNPVKSGSRLINDGKKEKYHDLSKTRTRKELFLKMRDSGSTNQFKIHNPYHSQTHFINMHHAALFKETYPYSYKMFRRRRKMFNLHYLTLVEAERTRMPSATKAIVDKMVIKLLTEEIIPKDIDSRLTGTITRGLGKVD